jgi:hypothetical protein
LKKEEERDRALRLEQFKAPLLKDKERLKLEEEKIREKEAKRARKD